MGGFLLFSLGVLVGAVLTEAFRACLEFWRHRPSGGYLDDLKRSGQKLDREALWLLSAQWSERLARCFLGWSVVDDDPRRVYRWPDGSEVHVGGYALCKHPYRHDFNLPSDHSFNPVMDPHPKLISQFEFVRKMAIERGITFEPGPNGAQIVAGRGLRLTVPKADGNLGIVRALCLAVDD